MEEWWWRFSARFILYIPRVCINCNSRWADAGWNALPLLNRLWRCPWCRGKVRTLTSDEMLKVFRHGY